MYKLSKTLIVSSTQTSRYLHKVLGFDYNPWVVVWTHRPSKISNGFIFLLRTGWCHQLHLYYPLPAVLCIRTGGGGGGRIIASENPAHSSHCHLRLTHVTCACSTLEAFASRARLLVLEAPLFFSSKYFVFVFRTDNARALDSLQYLFISARKKRHKFCTPRLWKWFL